MLEVRERAGICFVRDRLIHKLMGYRRSRIKLAIQRSFNPAVPKQRRLSLDEGSWTAEGTRNESGPGLDTGHGARGLKREIFRHARLLKQRAVFWFVATCRSKWTLSLLAWD